MCAIVELWKSDRLRGITAFFLRSWEYVRILRLKVEKITCANVEESKKSMASIEQYSCIMTLRNYTAVRKYRDITVSLISYFAWESCITFRTRGRQSPGLGLNPNTFFWGHTTWSRKRSLMLFIPTMEKHTGRKNFAKAV